MKVLEELERRMLGIKKVKKNEGMHEFDGYSLPERKKRSKLEIFILRKLHKTNMKHKYGKNFEGVYKEFKKKDGAEN